jgi:NADH-quinone oxidoreductase subunit G
LKPGRIPFSWPKTLEAFNPESPPSGDLRATFAPALFDRGERMKHNPHLIQLSKEPRVRLHPKEAQTRGIQDGEMVSIHANGNSITAKVHVDKRVAEKTVVLPLGFEEVPVQELGVNLLNGLTVELKKK